MKDLTGLKKAALKRMKLTVVGAMPNFKGDLSLEVSEQAEFLMDQMVLTLKAEVYGEHLRDHKFPADWWQAVKDRWFPDWLKRRYPVRYTIISRSAVYPEMSLPNGRVIEEAED